MEWRSDLLGFMLFISVVGLPSAVTGAEYCSLSQFSCQNGNCIPTQWRCDEEDDCQDNSDEDLCEPRICSIPEEFRCDNGQCIPSRWHCDGEPDCTDNSDEGKHSCEAVQCQPGHFSCGVGMVCIPSIWKCDGHEDCLNGLDEDHAICSNGSCGPDEFMCRKSRRCVTSRWLCDLDKDCEDGSDEVGCEPVVCTGSQWQCQNMHCIPAAWRCDGDVDCQDASDETNCTGFLSYLKPCGESEFLCNASRECIHEAWRCDGDDDCLDGSDEKNCGERTCSDLEFQCTVTGSCIPKHLLCDGVAQCHDGSDERNCPKEVMCDPQTTFDCSQGNRLNCIDINLVCNGVDDCGSAQDEAMSLCINKTNPCNVNNGGCSHICVFTHIGFYCKCPEGYMLHSDLRTCKDIDECEIFGTCSQMCENRKGSYKCSCRSGYEWDFTDRMCRATGELPSLLFANRHDIRKIHPYAGNYHLLIDGLKSAVALDYDYDDGVLFWSDIAMETINMIRLSNDSQASTIVLVRHDVSTPDGLAYDWIHKNLYWTDTGNNRIDVLTLPGKVLWRRTLINTNLDEPRAIVVDPRQDHRSMYWTDWGVDPKIERAFLDGSQRKQLITKDLQWPNGLTIDYESDLLFWVDAKWQTISSCDLDGQNRRIVISSNEYLHHPFAITVFEDFIYWTDWEVKSILKANKFIGSEREPVKQVALQLQSLMDIRVYHRLKQPTGANACFNSDCSHICLPSGSSSSYTCLCPDHEDKIYQLGADHKTCLLDTTVMPDIHHMTTEGSSHSEQLNVSEVNMTHAVDVGTALAAVNYRSPGQIAGAVVTILILIAVAVTIIAVTLYRCHIKQPLRSMNFDNPVYRKKTQEQQHFEEKIHYQPALPPTLEPLTLAGRDCV